MADIAASSAGVSRSLTPEQAQAIYGTDGPGEIGGYKPVSQEQGLQEAQREADIKLTQSDHPIAAAATGAVQGLTLGYGLPLMLGAGQALGADTNLARHRWNGYREGSPVTYGTGYAGGLLAGSALTGGALDELGAAAGLSRLLPEAVGITGQAVRGAASLGARGALEGGAMGLGNAVEQAALENKALTSEAMLVSLGEGALLGGGLGAVLGGAGGALKGVAGRVAESGAAKGLAEGTLAKHTGLNGLAKEIGGMEGGMTGVMQRSDEVLAEQGLKLSSSPEKILPVARKTEATFQKQIGHIADEFDKAGAKAPVWQDFANRVRQDMVGEVMMTPGGVKAAEGLSRIVDHMVPLNAEGKELASFKGWIQGREAMQSASKSLPGDMGTRMMAIYDEELRTAMQSAEGIHPTLTGSAGRYQAAQLGKATMRVLGDSAEARIASPAASLSTDGLGSAAVMAATGHPVAALSMAGAKMAKRLAGQALGPHVAEMVWKMNNSAKAVSAVTSLKQSIGKAIDGLFSAGVKGSTRAIPSRDQFNKELEQVYAFAGKDRESRINNFIRYSNSLPLAQGMDSVADRAVSGLLKDAPPTQGTQGIGSMRKMSQPKGLSVKEHIFLKKLNAAKGPLSVLEDVGNNRASKEQIATLKQGWPETYGLMVEGVQNKIAQMKADGEPMKMDKIVQLSLLLDSPLDSTLTKEFITPVQLALAEPPVSQAKQPQQPSVQNSADQYTTPAEKTFI